MERESSRKTSARNSFFGKIQETLRGTVQTQIEITTISGYKITTMITNESVEQLGLKKGKLITAEVKAPWVILHKSAEEPECSAENRFKGIVARINKGKINSEYLIRISGGTELCSIVTTKSTEYLDLKERYMVLQESGKVYMSMLMAIKRKLVLKIVLKIIQSS